MVAISRVGLIAVAAMALVGCASPGEPMLSDVPSSNWSTVSSEEPAPSSTASVSPSNEDPDAVCDEDDIVCIQQAQLPGLVDLIGLDGIPSEVPAPVRLVTQVEQTELIVACLREAGFDVQVSGSGYSFDLADEQLEVYKETQFACYARYPLLPLFTGPLSRVQLERVHTHFRDELIPCLAEEGFVVAELPTLETFLSQAESGVLASPFSDPAVMALGQAEWERLEQACPQMPSDDVLYAP